MLVTLPSTFERAATGRSLDAEPYTLLHANIRDAERSRALDRIVYISQDPDKLVVLDANRRTRQELELPRRAADLTLDVEGRHAVVSFDGRLGYYELEPLRLIHMWPVPEPLDRIAIDQDGYVYDVLSSSRKVRVDVATGAVQSSSEGNDGGPEVAQDVGHAFWYSADRRRLFGSTGRIFDISNPQAAAYPDIGALQNAQTGDLRGFAEHAASNRLAVIPSLSNVVALHDATTYAQLAAYDMPRFATDDATLQSGVRFVFFTRDGKQLSVLVQALVPAPVPQPLPPPAPSKDAIAPFGFVRIPVTQ